MQAAAIGMQQHLQDYRQAHHAPSTVLLQQQPYPTAAFANSISLTRLQDGQTTASVAAGGCQSLTGPCHVAVIYGCVW
jgi:hypothetical protein